MATYEAIKERLTTEGRAVSPVIGVILMVAITVILAAVIGTFVLDLGQSAGQSAPQASLSVSTDAGNDIITIEHTGGDAIVGSNTKVIIEEDSSGNDVTYEPTTDNTFTVGGSQDFNIGTAAIDSGAWSGNGGGTANGLTSLTPDNQYTITVIDLESQRQIFETTVTA